MKPRKISLISASTPSLFEALKIPADDPVWQRPKSDLPLDVFVQAARIVHAFSHHPDIQKFAPVVASFRLTRAEFAELEKLGRDAAATN
jgi:hypothetical protein